MAVDIRTTHPEPPRTIPKGWLISVPPFAVRIVTRADRLRRVLRVDIVTVLCFSLAHALSEARKAKGGPDGLSRRLIWIEHTSHPIRSLGGLSLSRNKSRHWIHPDRSRCVEARSTVPA